MAESTLVHIATLSAVSVAVMCLATGINIALYVLVKS